MWKKLVKLELTSTNVVAAEMEASGPKINFRVRSNEHYIIHMVRCDGKPGIQGEPE